MRRWILPASTVAVILIALAVAAPVLTGKARSLRRPTDTQLRAAFPGDSRQVLEQSQQFTLLSLNPSPATFEKEAFHGFGVLGKTEVAEAKKRASLIAALDDGIARAQESAACFNPRHGIRVVRDKKTVELVICFECMNFYVYANGNKSGGGISRDPQALFDRVLAEAGVPVAKDKP